MQNIFNLECSQNKSAVNLCHSQSCKYNPIMCQQDSCLCNKHQICKKVSIKQIKIIIQKRENISQKIFTKLEKWYSYFVKVFSSSLQKLQKEKQDKKYVPFGLENISLFSVFKGNNVKQLTSQHVHNFMTITSKQSEQQINQQVSKIDDSLLSYVNTVGKILKQININDFLTFNKSAQSLVFSQQLHHPGISLLSLNIIRSAKKGADKLALLQPSLQSITDKAQKHLFRIIKTVNKDIIFGICHLNTIIKNKFSLKSTSPGHGIYAINACNGYIMSNISDSQNLKPSKIPVIEVDQIVQITYQSNINRVLITNLNKKKSTQLVIKHQKDNPFYLFVRTYGQGDEIQYLGGK